MEFYSLCLSNTKSHRSHHVNHSHYIIPNPFSRLCSISFLLSVLLFINSCFSQFLMFILSLGPFFSPQFCQLRETQRAISKQFITCRMYWVQYPSPHLSAASITHFFCPSPSYSLLSQMQQNEFVLQRLCFMCSQMCTHKNRNLYHRELVVLFHSLYFIINNIILS